MYLRLSGGKVEVMVGYPVTIFGMGWLLVYYEVWLLKLRIWEDCVLSFVSSVPAP
ncbi:hypothetical protein BDZ91DRAFT_731595 [Kalaharituber pfeilii]|nr:hypothetical protein BDZ91DRAFT_731595 [Kalaharituber pfeilii]